MVPRNFRHARAIIRDSLRDPVHHDAAAPFASADGIGKLPSVTTAWGHLRMAMADTGAEKRTPQLFGHPRGLTFLFTTEMWERFSYYGMRAILVLYLTKMLFTTGHFDHVIGYQGLHHFAQWLMGSIDTGPVQNGTYQPQFASLIYGGYTGLVYLTPFFGGIIADRWLGQRFSVIIGGVTMAIAEFVLMEPNLLFVGLLLLIVGNGFFKPNISTQV